MAKLSFGTVLKVLVASYHRKALKDATQICVPLCGLKKQ